MRGLLLAAAVCDVLSTACQANATPVRRAPDSSIQVRREMAATPDRATGANVAGRSALRRRSN